MLKEGEKQIMDHMNEVTEDKKYEKLNHKLNQ